MKKNIDNSRAFYQNLGKLFYAIAVVDGNVREFEENALKKMVKEHWLPMDDSFPMIDVFNWLNADQEYNAEDCFDGFIAFKKENEHLFTQETKQLIVRTANAIASSFSGKNKSELIMLARLSIELKK